MEQIDDQYPQGRKDLIQPDDYLEMRIAADKLGVSQTQLKEAMNAVGFLASDITVYLKSKGYIKPSG